MELSDLAIVVRGGLLGDPRLLMKRARDAKLPPPMGIGLLSLSVQADVQLEGESTDDAMYRLGREIRSDWIRMTYAGRLRGCGLQLVQTRSLPHHSVVFPNEEPLELEAAILMFIEVFEPAVRNTGSNRT